MKTIFKISYIAFAIAWLPVMFVFKFGSAWPITLKGALFSIALIFWVVGLITFLACTQDRYFWNTKEELAERIEKAKEAQRKYVEAADKLVAAALRIEKSNNNE